MPEDGTSLLHVAAEDGDVELLDYLIDAEATSGLEVFDYVGRTPLACAIDARSLVCVERLIEAGANVNAEDGDLHRTCRVPLQRATEDGRVEIARALLAAGADPNLAACGMVHTPIELARLRPNTPELLEMMLKPPSPLKKKRRRRSNRRAPLARDDKQVTKRRVNS